MNEHLKGMISLTFDDGRHVHLDHAVPILDKLGMYGTFYIHINGETAITRINEWKAASIKGHEIGNHTIFHPATKKKKWVIDGYQIEDYSLPRMREEMVLANRILSLINKTDKRTFAYPCSNSKLGSEGYVKKMAELLPLGKNRVSGLIDKLGLEIGNKKQSYQSIVSEIFYAARGGGLNIEQEPPAISSFERYHLPSAAVDNHDLNSLKKFVERAINKKSWAILQFHDLGNNVPLSCSLEVFESYCKWLADNYADNLVTIEQGTSLLLEQNLLKS